MWSGLGIPTGIFLSASSRFHFWPSRRAISRSYRRQRFSTTFLRDPAGSGWKRKGFRWRKRSAPARSTELLLKPLFSFAGKGIQFEPTRELLESIPAEQRSGYLLQQRMRFEHTIETPHGLTQAEFRILYLWPEDGELTPVLSLVRLGRGKMMGVDHNRNQEWVGASAAFYPHEMGT